MNKDKVIKDLKERNNLLNNQFRLRDIRVNCLEHQNIEKDKEIERINNIIKEVREYIEEKEGILLNCDEEWLDHDEMIDKKRFKKILEILDKDNK